MSERNGNGSGPTRRCEVLIAGAGPAGLATALYLLRRRPDLAGKIIALERARHPRPKVCAGGLIPKTLAALDELGLDLDVPAAVVRRGIAVTEAGRVDLPGDDVLCKVIRRDQFDASLARPPSTRELRSSRSAVCYMWRSTLARPGCEPNAANFARR